MKQIERTETEQLEGARIAHLEPSNALILKAARQELRYSSYHEFNMQQVAQAAGVSRRTIYNYFRDRDDLYVASRQALLNKVATALLQEVTEALPSAIDPAVPTAGSFREFVVRTLRVLTGPDHQDLLLSLLRDGATQPWLPTTYAKQITAPVKRALAAILSARKMAAPALNAEETAGLMLRLAWTSAMPAALLDFGAAASTDRWAVAFADTILSEHARHGEVFLVSAKKE